MNTDLNVYYFTSYSDTNLRIFYSKRFRESCSHHQASLKSEQQTKMMSHGY